MQYICSSKHSIKVHCSTSNRLSIMKQRFKLLIITLLSTASLYAQGDLKLWYEQPAHRWVEALPLGNGSMGAMVFGGVSSELIQLNEATLWSGGPLPNNVNPEAYKYLQPIREALANNNYGLADELCRKMQGNYTESYLPLGDLHINQRFKHLKLQRVRSKEVEEHYSLSTKANY